MTATICRNVFESPNMTPVSVIASFDAAGHILPLYVRIDGVSCKIHSATYKQKYCFHAFQCDVEVNGYMRNITLLYHAKECAWVIPSRIVA